MGEPRNPYRADLPALEEATIPTIASIVHRHQVADAWDEGFAAALEAVEHQALIHAGLTRSVLSADTAVAMVKEEAGNE